MLSDLVKSLLYRTGVLGAIHRWRNRRTLTVVMFHRVLSPTDPRWAGCDPDYTLDSSLFADSLRFFRRHYSIVSAADVLAATRDGAALPPRALLITFDDGWADTHDHALPALREHAMPALLFAVADAIGRRQPFFQEQLIAAWRERRLTLAELGSALREQGIPKDAAAGEDMDELRRLIAALEAMDDAAREALLARFHGAMDDRRRHMLDANELNARLAGGVAIGLHGKTHRPLTRVDDLDAELSGARAIVASLLDGQAPIMMSYPHGRHDEAIVARTFDAGYALAFTSVPGMNEVTPRPSRLLARLGFEQSGISDAAGRFRPEWLALYLFRAPHRRLSA
jgi:peptidoglycan/xylan/chitin deacetylase (PgdA/CDA1 family)